MILNAGIMKVVYSDGDGAYHTVKPGQWLKKRI
jgi:hypothetical protein